MAERFGMITPAPDSESHQSIAEEPSIEYKPHGNINVDEVSDGTTSPRSNTLRLSNTTTSEKDSFIRSSTIRSRAEATLSKTGTWTYEVIGLFLGAAAVAAIVAVLAYFDGRAVPDWPIDITLGALIALLATVANANLSAPIQSSVSQLKWIRFKTNRAPLIDMEIYDEASRGTVGAVKLLLSLRGGVFGSFGAILTIVALALGPFAQQVASYRSHMRELMDGALIPRALNYSGYLPGRSSTNGFVPILPMKAAVYSGLFAESGVPDVALNVTCSTGNCTFTPFETLAICHQCVDMTSFMTRYCEDGLPANGETNDCGWQLPNGQGFLNKSTDAFSMSSAFPSSFGDMPYASIMQLTFMGTESQTVPDQLNPWSTQCTLSACVQTISSGVTDGHLVENITATTLNNTVVDISNAKVDVPVVITGPSNETFFMLMSAKLAMESWFSDLFRNGSASRSAQDTNQTISDSNVIVNLTVGVSSGETFFDTDIVTAFYWNYYEYPNGIDMLMEDLAISMTVAIRSFNGAVPHPGLSLSWESYVHVRWVFISLPVIVVFLTAIFLAATAWRTYQSKTKLWKSSSLAVLFHGLDAETRERIGTDGSLNEKRKKASKFRVQLDDSGDTGSLLRD